VKKRRLAVFVAMAVVVVAALALDALTAGSAIPTQLVSARKAAMQSNAANLGDMSAKEAAGNLKAIAVLIAFVPTAYGDTYADAYPAGTKFFFKGGGSAAGRLAESADKSDKSAIDALLPAVLGACGACHHAYRGSR
jgi:cytochrome c556